VEKDTTDKLEITVIDEDGNKETILIPDYIVDFVEMIFGRDCTVYTDEQRNIVALLMLRLAKITEVVDQLISTVDAVCCDTSQALLDKKSVDSLAETMKDLVAKDKIQLAPSRHPGFPVIGPHGRDAENLATAVFLWIMAHNEIAAKKAGMSHESRGDHLNTLGGEFMAALAQIANLHPVVSFVQVLEAPKSFWKDCVSHPSQEELN